MMRPTFAPDIPRINDDAIIPEGVSLAQWANGTDVLHYRQGGARMRLRIDPDGNVSVELLIRNDDGTAASRSLVWVE